MELNRDREAVNVVGQIAVADCRVELWRDAYHTVWAIDGRVGGFQEMADAADVRIHVFHAHCIPSFWRTCKGPVRSSQSYYL